MLNLRLYAYLAATLAIVGLLWMVNGWRVDAGKLDASEARTAQIEREAKATIAEMQNRYAASQKASEGYQHELQIIRDRPMPITGPIKLCRSPSVPAARPVVSGPINTLPATEPLPEPARSDTEPGVDIGPALRELARHCDEVSAKGRAIQSLF